MVLSEITRETTADPPPPFFNIYQINRLKTTITKFKEMILINLESKLDLIDIQRYSEMWYECQ